MKINRRKAQLLRKAINTWQQEGALTPEQAEKLRREHIEETVFDWSKLAHYALWLAVICFVIAVGALVADNLLMQIITDFLNTLFNTPDYAKALIFAGISAVLYYVAWQRRQKTPDLAYSNEIYFLMGVFTTIISAVFFHSSYNFSAAMLDIIFLLLMVTYFTVGWYCRSQVVWVFALLATGGFLVVSTGYQNGWETHFLGLNYPLRLVFLGIVMTAAGKAMYSSKALANFQTATYVTGLFYLFCFLWFVSIVGNYGRFTAWIDASQTEFIGWALLLGTISIGAIIYGIKYNDRPAYSFGILFLLINLYTRYVEYVWSEVHVAVFFTILAISFWLLGIKAEKIWYLSQNK